MVFQIRSRIIASGFINILALASTITLTVVSSQAQDNRQPLQPMPALTPNGGTAGTSNSTSVDTRAPANVVGRPVVKPVQLLKRAPVAAKSKSTVKTCGQSKASKEVQKMVADGNLAGAIDRWSTEIESKPNHSEAWIGRAKLRRQIGDNNGAQDDLDRALELSPNNVEALIARASVRRRLTDLRGAGKDIDRAVELAPRSFQALSERSSLRFALNDIQGAMADYNYAMSLNKGGGRQSAQTSPAVAQNSGKTTTAGNQNSVQANGQTAPATAHNLQSNNQSSNGKNVASGSNGSNNSGNNSNNIQGKKISSSKKPLLSASELARLNNTAVQEINDKHFGAAIKSFERLIEVSPDYAHAKQNLVIAHNNYGLELALRTPAEAIKHFRAALYLDPTQSAIRKNLASMISEMGKDPDSADDRAELADGCLAINDHEGAYVELNEAIRLKNSPQLRMRMMAVLAGITSTESQFSTASKNAPQGSGEAVAPSAVATATAIVAPDLIQTEKIESEPDASHMIAAEVVQPNTASTQTAATQIAQPSGQPLGQAIGQATGQAIAADPLEHYESPSATPAHDLVIDKLTLETSPDMVLQVARQLASENHELDAEGLLMRLCDNLRKKSLRGDRTAEAVLENTLETLSQLYVKASRWPNAETSLRELVAIREKTKGQEDPVLGRTLAEYSAILKTLGRHEEAQKQELKANFILNRALSAQ